MSFSCRPILFLFFLHFNTCYLENMPVVDMHFYVEAQVMTMLGWYVNLCISVMETFPSYKQSAESIKDAWASLGLKQTFLFQGSLSINKILVVSEMQYVGNLLNYSIKVCVALYRRGDQTGCETFSPYRNGHWKEFNLQKLLIVNLRRLN